MQKVHKILIFDGIFKYAFILLLPLLRRLLANPSALTLTVLLEFFAAALIVFVAVLKWKKTSYMINKNFFIFSRGIIFKHVTALPLKSIASIDVDEGVFARFWGAARVRISTQADDALSLGFGRDLFSFPVKPGLARSLMAHIGGKAPERATKFGFLKSALAALSSSNAFWGLFLAVPLINQAGKILDVELDKRLIGTVSYAQALTARFLPPAVSAAAYIFLAGWLISFFHLSARSANFTLRSGESFFKVARGSVAPRTTLANRRHITAYVSGQTLLARALGLVQTRALCAGYGRERGEMNLLLPAASAGETEEFLRGACGIRLSPIEIAPPKSAARRFYAAAAAPLVILTAACAAGLLLFGAHARLVLLLFVPLFVFFAARGLMLIWEARASGFSKDLRVVRAVKGFSLFTVYLPENGTVKIKISQNIFQKKDGLCNAKLFIRGPRPKAYAVRNIEEGDIAETIG